MTENINIFAFRKCGPGGPGGPGPKIYFKIMDNGHLNNIYDKNKVQIYSSSSKFSVCLYKPLHSSFNI